MRIPVPAGEDGRRCLGLRGGRLAQETHAVLVHRAASGVAAGQERTARSMDGRIDPGAAIRVLARATPKHRNYDNGLGGGEAALAFSLQHLSRTSRTPHRRSAHRSHARSHRSPAPPSRCRRLLGPLLVHRAEMHSADAPLLRQPVQRTTRIGAAPQAMDITGWSSVMFVTAHVRHSIGSTS